VNPPPPEAAEAAPNREPLLLKDSVDLLHAFGDATRLRILSLLSQAELSVAEVVSVLEMSQSRVSTHLGKLREARLVEDRKEGTSRVYSLAGGGLRGSAEKLWELLAEGLDDAVLEGDRRRVRALLEAREAEQGWAEAAAGRMERHYSPGRTWEALARGLVPLLSLGDVLDVGCGDGVLASLLAPRSKSYTGLDKSPKVLDAARRRLAGLPRIELVQGPMEALPFPDGSFDAVLLFHVLTYARDTHEALSEAVRVLRPQGRIVAVTLAAHEHVSTTERYGHVRSGFAPAALRAALVRSKLSVDCCSITSRETREPHFEVLTAVATKLARQAHSPNG
jgi:SAM-dependent methyltransferase